MYFLIFIKFYPDQGKLLNLLNLPRQKALGFAPLKILAR